MRKANLFDCFVKSDLFHDDDALVKKSSGGNFDVHQGSFDGVEVFELMGIFILSKVNKIFLIGSNGIYWEEVVIVIQDNKRCHDSIRLKLSKLFKVLDFDITVEMNRKAFQYLDSEFDLLAGAVSPYMKPSTILIYVNTKFKRPTNVIKHIPMGVECRLSRNSSAKEIFEKKERIHRRIPGRGA